MALLAITKIGNPVLRQKAKLLSDDDLARPEIRRLIEDMIETMRKAEGVGLAANQVGEGLKLCVMECPVQNPRYPQAPAFPLEIWVNPEIVECSTETETGWEGCLSIPGYRGMVTRARWIIVQALTSEGKRVQQRFDGFHARVMQHEVDHLNGFFYVDRLKDLRQWTHLEEMQRNIQAPIDAGKRARS